MHARNFFVISYAFIYHHFHPCGILKWWHNRNKDFDFFFAVKILDSLQGNSSLLYRKVLLTTENGTTPMIRTKSAIIRTNMSLI